MLPLACTGFPVSLVTVPVMLTGPTVTVADPVNLSFSSGVPEKSILITLNLFYSEQGCGAVVLTSVHALAIQLATPFRNATAATGARPPPSVYRADSASNTSDDDQPDQVHQELSVWTKDILTTGFPL
jgi:hypothetical protein